jgi:predicted alpha-1,2-mannosidase
MRIAFRRSLPILLFLALLQTSLHGQPGARYSGGSVAAPGGPADEVNPFVGTAPVPVVEGMKAGVFDTGNTYPGAALPLGMVQWSPDTETGFLKRRTSYFYGDDGIRGFSLNHLSGAGCQIFGDVLIQPIAHAVNSSPATDASAYWAKFSHANENASPGYYSVGFASGVKVQLAVTTRAGIGEFTFPASTESAVLFNVGRDATVVHNASIEITGDRQIAGSVSAGNFCRETRDKYTVYFAAEFSRPFSSFGTWKDASVTKGQRLVEGPVTGGWVGFDTTQNQKVVMRVALSYVSTANARKNLAMEIPGWDFNTVRQAAHERWNHDLNLIHIEGGTSEQRRVFYTALYHALLHPNIFDDVNGDYMGFDSKVHRAQGFNIYANYSGWDIYRCEMQLLAMLFPKAASDMAHSLVLDAEQGGGLPLWAAANNETCQMVGNPSSPIIADVYAFGGRDFDAHAALAAMLKGATDPNAKSVYCTEWPGLSDYMKDHFLGPDSITWHNHPSGPAEMLEYTTADFSIAQLAQAIGDQNTYQTFMKRAQYWRNTFDTKVGYVEPRKKDGTFVEEAPDSATYFVEGNPAQYSWMVPYDMRGLIDVMGGNAKVVERLDTFFTELNAGAHKPYFWIGNEPVFAVPWAYDFAGAPWATQAVVRRAELELFSSQPNGEPGNEDLGATSAWYVFAALGAYPAIPAVGGMALNSPLFPSATIHLGNGKIFKIEGEGAAASNPYVQSLLVNGKPSEKTWIPYETLSQGATLQFKLGSTPNKEWGTRPEDAPPSFEEGAPPSGK